MKTGKNSQNKGSYALKLNVKQKYHILIFGKILEQMNFGKGSNISLQTKGIAQLKITDL